MSLPPQRETLLEHLERMYKMPDIRPCDHIFESNEHGGQQCVRCRELQSQLNGAD